MDLKKEKSCGCIVIKDEKVLLVYEKNRNFWGFPKGHMEPGESELETAAREVKEEVGLDVEIDEKKRYELHYIIEDKNVEKTTVLYVAKTSNEDVVKQESEIEKAKWCDFDEALSILTFDDWKELLKKVIEDMKS